MEIKDNAKIMYVAAKHHQPPNNMITTVKLPLSVNKALKVNRLLQAGVCFETEYLRGTCSYVIYCEMKPIMPDRQETLQMAIEIVPDIEWLEQKIASVMNTIVDKVYLDVFDPEVCKRIRAWAAAVAMHEFEQEM